MSIGYDVHEDKRSFEQDGITGEVNRYSKVDIAYPYFKIVNTEDNKVPYYKIKSLPSMLVSSSTESDISELEKSIQVYFQDGDTIIRIGKILPRHVKRFLGLFEGYTLECMLTKDKKLDNEFMYILSN